MNKKELNHEKWTENNVPNQTGRIAIITGSNTGLGFETARILADRGARVILAVRSLAKGESAKNRICELVPKADLEVMNLDLGDLNSIENFANSFVRSSDQLDILINNAGVMIPPFSQTLDGFELQIGTNHLGHFALVGRLLHLLKATENSRVVNVSSLAHRRGNLDLEDLNWQSRRYSAWQAYADSKLANLYFTYELERRFEAHEYPTIAVAAHPGGSSTELARHSRIFGVIGKIIGQSSEKGALPSLRAATDKDVKGSEYYGPSGIGEISGYATRVDSNARSKDTKIARNLWDISEELTGVKYEF